MPSDAALTGVKQPSFLNFFQEELGTTRIYRDLDRIEKVIPWGSIIHEIESHRPEKCRTGRPRKDILMLVKTLFLQGLYTLSDPEAEDCIRDRLSFQKFLGITQTSDVPDETTLCRFRNELISHGIQEDIFTMTQRMLTLMGYSVQKGHIQDGTILDAPKGRKRSDGTSTRDPEASFTQKNGRSYHGYKGHVEVSSDSTFIMNATFTTASVHDSQVQDSLMLGDETIGHGDAAYGMNKAKNERYEADGLQVEFHEKGTRGHELGFFQKLNNRIKSRIRAKVEHPFAKIKCQFGYTAVRYRGLLKNGMQWLLMCALYNFDRLARL